MSVATYHMLHPYSSLVVATLRRFLRPIFVETGSNTGHGVQAALAAGFEEIHSVEAVEELYASCCERFRAEPRVQLYLDDSPAFLRMLLPTLMRPAVLYLDAHSIERNPLLDELQAVAEQKPAVPYTLMIDDVRMFDTADWHGLRRADALAWIKRICPSYTLFYVDTPNARGDLLVARVP